MYEKLDDLEEREKIEEMEDMKITYLTDGPARIEIGSDYLIVGALNRILATQ